MKILVISHTETISRYFEEVTRAISSKLQAEVEVTKIVSYPSAYNFNKEKAILLPKKMNKDKKKISKIFLKDEFYKGFDLKKLIYFHTINQKMFNVNLQERIEIQAIKYIDYFEELFNQSNFDLVLIWGEGRIITDVPVEFAKRNKIKTIFFEQGPYGTLLIDKSGVNYNSSFNKADYDSSPENKAALVKEFINRRSEQKYYDKNKLKYINKISDFLWMAPPIFARKYFPIDTQTFESFGGKISEAFNRLFRKNNASYLPNETQKFILLALQVPWDAQMILHSPNFNSITEMVEEVINSLPSEYELIVKEHPLYVGKYEKSLYDVLNNYQNVKIINNTPLNVLIDNAEVVIVNNSTVGIEALANYSKVITLGNAFYNNDKVLWKFESGMDLHKLISKVINSDINTNEIDKFLYDLFFNYLIHDHHKNLDFNSIEIAADRILSENLSNVK